MAALTNLIAALGLDSTVWIQLGIALFMFVYLITFVFKPYYSAFTERESRTTGNHEKAEQVYAQTRELEALYQRKARSMNADIKELFDKARGEAAREQERIQSEARSKAKASIDKAKEKIQGEINKAREDLIKQAPDLSRAISEKLVPEEV